MYICIKSGANSVTGAQSFQREVGYNEISAESLGEESQ